MAPRAAPRVVKGIKRSFFCAAVNSPGGIKIGPARGRGSVRAVGPRAASGSVQSSPAPSPRAGETMAVQVMPWPTALRSARLYASVGRPVRPRPATRARLAALSMPQRFADATPEDDATHCSRTAVGQDTLSTSVVDAPRRRGTATPRHATWPGARKQTLLPYLAPIIVPGWGRGSAAHSG